MPRPRLQTGDPHSTIWRPRRRRLPIIAKQVGASALVRDQHRDTNHAVALHSDNLRADAGWSWRWRSALTFFGIAAKSARSAHSHSWRRVAVLQRMAAAIGLFCLRGVILNAYSVDLAYVVLFTG